MSEKHVIVHLIDGDTHEISKYPTTLVGSENREEAAIRVLDEQHEAQKSKHFLVEDVIDAPSRGRHKGEKS